MFKPTANVLSRFSLFFAILFLAACGGSSNSTTTVTPVGPVGDTPEDTSSGTDDFSGNEVKDYFVGEGATLKAGVFLGELTYKNEDTPSVEGLMLLSATGNYTFILDTDSNFLNADVVSGTLTLDGNAIEGSAFEYKLSDKWERTTGRIPGRVSSKELASLEPGGLVENAEIVRDPEASDQSLSFSQIAGGTGLYSGSDSQITIDTEGRITGSDRGCMLEGQITIPVADINIFELSYEAKICDDLPSEGTSAERKGEYLGVGTFTPAVSEGEKNIVEFAASNGKVAFYFAGTR